MNKQNIGNKIAALRKEKGYTQKQLAEKLHVTDKAVSNWERGNNLPDIAILEPLSNLLDTSIIEILDLENISSEKLTLSMLKMAIEERNQIIDEVKKDNFAIIIHYILQLSTIFIAFGLSMVTFDDYGIGVVFMIASVATCGCGFSFTASLRNHFRIKKYYSVKTEQTSTHKEKFIYK